MTLLSHWQLVVKLSAFKDDLRIPKKCAICLFSYVFSGKFRNCPQQDRLCNSCKGCFWEYRWTQHISTTVMLLQRRTPGWKSALPCCNQIKHAEKMVLCAQIYCRKIQHTSQFLWCTRQLLWGMEILLKVRRGSHYQCQPPKL